MTIEDPTAIPETAEQLTEYVAEADQAWNHGNQDRAWSLYHSIFSSSIPEASEHWSLAAFRLGSMAVANGDADSAHRFLGNSHEPGTADLLRALEGATPDSAVDPSVVPQTDEEFDRYANALLAARRNGDTATLDALVAACWDSPAATPGNKGALAAEISESLLERGDNDTARQWAEAGVSLSSGPTVERLRKVLRAVGSDVDDGGNPYQTDVTTRLLAGIAAYEQGDLATARTELEAVIAATDGATPEDKGRAHYYLGAMDYQAAHYAAAREHLHHARDTAPAEEQGWAVEMLDRRWDEEESPL